MRLHIIRHGKAEDLSLEKKDFDRDLSTEGVEQIKLLNNYFSSTLGVSSVWCSSANRTKQTYSGIKSLVEGAEIHFHEDFYLCKRDFLLSKIWSNTNKGDLLIIGHNFGISQLAAYLLDEPIELGTSEYISIDFDAENWEEISNGTGTIHDRFRPLN